MIREYTNKIADMVDEGLVSKKYIIEQLLMWLSEDDAREFYMANLAPEFDVDEEDE